MVTNSTGYRELFWTLHPDGDVHPCVQFSKRFLPMDPNRDQVKFQIMDGLWNSHAAIPLRLDGPRCKVPDMFTNLWCIIISPCLVHMLQAIAPTGLAMHPIDLYDHDDARVVEPGWMWLRLPVGMGSLDTHKGSFLAMTAIQRRDIELRDAIGLYFDPATWAGLELFCAVRSNIVMMTERVAGGIDTTALHGVRLEAATNYGTKARDDLVAMLKKRFPNGLPPHIP